MSHIGRNEPCPCGSGKKYKKCCLDKDQMEQRAQRVLRTPIKLTFFLSLCRVYGV
ncbi:MAG: SEC-C metal-binding domain-containing protein [Desulfuromonadaceae bacterium]